MDNSTCIFCARAHCSHCRLLADGSRWPNKINFGTRSSLPQRRELLASRSSTKIYNITATGHASITANLVSGYFLVSSIKTLKSENPELEDALKTIAGYVESLGASETNEAFNNFNKNVRDKSSNGTLRTLWNEVVRLLPDAVKITDATVAISKHLGA